MKIRKLSRKETAFYFRDRRRRDPALQVAAPIQRSRPELFRRPYRNGGPRRRQRAIEVESRILMSDPFLERRIQRAACRADVLGWDVALERWLPAVLDG